MRSCRFITILIIAAAFVVAAQASSQAELRFGPWVYWAPYYYPSPEKLRMLGFHAKDFAPRYQSPNPIAPKSDGYVPAPRKRPRKVASRAAYRQRVRPPEMNRPKQTPRPVSTQPRASRSKPTLAPGTRMIESRMDVRVQPQRSSARNTVRGGEHNRSRLRWGTQGKPRAVASDPVTRHGAPAPPVIGTPR
jgi:hypothetical protein